MAHNQRLMELRERLGREVYDKIPAQYWKVSNVIIEIMADMENLAGELGEPKPAPVVPLRPNASPAEVREHLSAYRGNRPVTLERESDE